MSKRFPGRRLSAVRVVFVFIFIGLLSAAGASGFRTLKDTTRAADDASWFAGYVDATVTPRFAFETPRNRASRDLVLSFVVAGPSQRCMPTWGAAYSLDEAAAQLDLDRRVARLRQAGGSVIVSFGGQRNDELAVACTDPQRLQDAYAEVIDRYGVTTVDLDLEGPSLSDDAANERRAEALTAIQKAQQAKRRSLAVWLTLPVSTGGLTEEGTRAVATTLGSGLKVAGVNAMTMNFGASRRAGQSISDASIAALKATHRQLMILSRRAGDQIGPATAWKRIGATPMIGQNDLPGETFTLADARKLSAFAVDKGLGRLSLWSLNRDQTCGDNYADLEVVSNACSGVRQGDVSFAAILGKGFTGRPDRASAKPTVDEDPAATTADDPASSPYAIWSANDAYLPNTKVVWKHNVYVAKWWTRGDAPDNPVLQEHETPWTLVGPVLPGEKPIVAPKIAAFAYPRWQQARVYVRGDRVLVDGVGFEAKWWTQGNHPTAGVADGADPGASPWARLTDQQVKAVNAARAERAGR